MPQLTNPHDIRRLLRRDPIWSVYALGDLAAPMFSNTQWFTPDVTLVLHAFGTTILFADGTGSIREALDHVTWPVHLQVREDALAEIERSAVVEHQRQMWRMSWNDRSATIRRGGTSIPIRRGGTLVPPGQAQRLNAADVPALLELYADGDATGEAPDFFFPSMVPGGAFFGIYDGERLSAAAGTHLLSREEGAAAIGNVYTRRDCRGLGLGRIVTASVLSVVAGIETVGLNVRADNPAAIRLYESLGFVRHCLFHEGLATIRK